MPSRVAGALKSVGVTLGARCTALTTTPSVGVESFVSRAYGVRRKILAIMHGSSGESLTTVRHANDLRVQAKAIRARTRSNDGIRVHPEVQTHSRHRRD
jgi:hypothetical protein